MRVFSLSLLLVFFLSGCATSGIDVSSGNKATQERLNKESSRENSIMRHVFDFYRKPVVGLMVSRDAVLIVVRKTKHEIPDFDDFNVTITTAYNLKAGGRSTIGDNDIADSYLVYNSKYANEIVLHQNNQIKDQKYIEASRMLNELDPEYADDITAMDLSYYPKIFFVGYIDGTVKAFSGINKTFLTVLDGSNKKSIYNYFADDVKNDTSITKEVKIQNTSYTDMKIKYDKNSAIIKSLNDWHSGNYKKAIVGMDDSLKISQECSKIQGEIGLDLNKMLDPAVPDAIKKKMQSDFDRQIKLTMKCNDELSDKRADFPYKSCAQNYLELASNIGLFANNNFMNQEVHFVKSHIIENGTELACMVYAKANNTKKYYKENVAKYGQANVTKKIFDMQKKSSVSNERIVESIINHNKMFYDNKDLFQLDLYKAFSYDEPYPTYIVAKLLFQDLKPELDSSNSEIKKITPTICSRLKKHKPSFAPIGKLLNETSECNSNFKGFK